MSTRIPYLQEIDVLLLDFGNVLFDLDIPKWYEQMLRLLGKESIQKHTVEKAQQLFRRYELGALSENAFVHQFIDLSQENISRADVLQAWNSIFVKMDADIFSLLTKLKKSYKLILLSNINETHYNFVFGYLKEVHQVTDWDRRYFDHSFYSHLMHMRKPDAEIYSEVIRQTGLESRRTLFIDDLQENLDGASPLGFKTLRKDPKMKLSKLLSDFGLMV